MIADEDSLNILSALYPNISYTHQADGGQQLFSAEDKEKRGEGNLEQKEYPELYPEGIKVIKEAPAREYVNFFTEFSSFQQNQRALLEVSHFKKSDAQLIFFCLRRIGY